MAISVQARLDQRTGRRVLCGARGGSCGAELAYVSDHEVIDGYITQPGVPIPVGMRLIHVRQVYFACGATRRQDGVWQYGEHAARRTVKRQRPQGRRGKELRWREGDAGGTSYGILHPTPDALPVLVKCPEAGGCGTVNLLDSDVLRVTHVGQLAVNPGAVGGDFLHSINDEPLCHCCMGRSTPSEAETQQWHQEHTVPLLPANGHLHELPDPEFVEWFKSWHAHLREMYPRRSKE